MPRRAGFDASLLSLVVVNLLALGIAIALRMSPRDLMLVYWMQSVIIGVMNVIRIVLLKDFSTTGFTMGGRTVEVTPAAKYRTAAFFALHYGFFHLGYLVFLAIPLRGEPALQASGALLGLCALMFLVQHAFSLRHTLARDAEGRPNLGTLMFMPYLRIVPMHFTIIFGLGFLGGGGPALLLFGVLKTVADAAMHVVQHRLLARPPGSR